MLGLQGAMPTAKSPANKLALMMKDNSGPSKGSKSGRKLTQSNNVSEDIPPNKRARSSRLEKNTTTTDKQQINENGANQSTRSRSQKKKVNNGNDPCNQDQNNNKDGEASENSKDVKRRSAVKKSNSAGEAVVKTKRAKSDSDTLNVPSSPTRGKRRSASNVKSYKEPHSGDESEEQTEEPVTKKKTKENRERSSKAKSASSEENVPKADNIKTVPVQKGKKAAQKPATKKKEPAKVAVVKLENATRTMFDKPDSSVSPAGDECKPSTSKAAVEAVLKSESTYSGVSTSVTAMDDGDSSSDESGDDWEEVAGEMRLQLPRNIH